MEELVQKIKDAASAEELERLRPPRPEPSETADERVESIAQRFREHISGKSSWQERYAEKVKTRAAEREAARQPPEPEPTDAEDPAEVKQSTLEWINSAPSGVLAEVLDSQVNFATKPQKVRTAILEELYRRGVYEAPSSEEPTPEETAEFWSSIDGDEDEEEV